MDLNALFIQRPQNGVRLPSFVFHLSPLSSPFTSAPLLCLLVFPREAASIRHVIGPQPIAAGGAQVSDKGRGVKSERFVSLSLGAALWSSSGVCRQSTLHKQDKPTHRRLTPGTRTSRCLKPKAPCPLPMRGLHLRQVHDYPHLAAAAAAQCWETRRTVRLHFMENITV